MTYNRPITANERLYLEFGKDFPAVVIQLVIQGKGRLGREVLRKAVDKVSESLPGTRLQAVKGKWVASAASPIVLELDSFPDLGSNLNSFMELSTNFDAVAGRTTELAFASQGEKFVLVFRALHAVMDGQGLLQWAKSVFQVLRGESVPISDWEGADDQLLKKVKASKRKDDPVFLRCAGPKATKIPERDFHFDYARIRLPKLWPGLIGRCALGLDKLLNADGKSKSIIMVPVDARVDLLPFTSSLITANMSLPLFIPVTKADSWPDVSARILSQVEQKKYLSYGRMSWLYGFVPAVMLRLMLRMFYRRELSKGQYYASAVLTHVGRIDIAEFQAGNFKAEDVLFLPSPMPLAPLSLVISEGHAATEICLVKSRELWSDPADLLREVLRLADIDLAVEPPGVPAQVVSEGQEILI